MKLVAFLFILVFVLFLLHLHTMNEVERLKSRMDGYE